MATFTVTIHTPAKKRPGNRIADLAERGIIQSVLLQIVSAVSNAGSYEGSAAHCGGGTAVYRYETPEAAK